MSEHRQQFVIQEIINGSPGDFERYSISSNYAKERFLELKNGWPDRKFVLVKRTTTDDIIDE